MKPELKTVFVPSMDTKVDNDNRIIFNDGGFVFGEKLITFTPEQYNQHIQEIIKDVLYQATQHVELQYQCGKKSKENCLAVFCRNCTKEIDKQSITNTFDETYVKYKL